MTKSSVSIIIPTYNRAPTILRAVASALQQCEDHDEVIVIDDGSTDDTEQVLKPYMEKIMYCRVQNGGVGYARNIGLNTAKNEYIAFLDSDDEWLPGKLSLQKRLLDAKPELVFCFSKLVEKHPDGKTRKVIVHEDLGERLIGPGVSLSTIANVPNKWGNVSVHIGDLYLTQMNYICVQVNTTLSRRKFLADDIRFSEDLSYHEDWEFFSRLARKGLVAYLDCETAIQHYHHLPQLTDATKIHVLNQRLIVLDRVWGEDGEFLDVHGDAFQKRKREVQLDLLEALLGREMFREIREIIRNIKHPPFKYRCILYIPDAVAKILLILYRKIKHSASHGFT